MIPSSCIKINTRIFGGISMQKISILANVQIKKRIIFLEQHFEALRKLGDLHIYDRETFDDEDYIVEFLRGSDIIITAWGSPRITDKMLAACPNLVALIHAGGSVKGVVNDSFAERGIRVSSAAKELSRGVAETALGAAIAACKGMFALSQQTRDGLWRENYDIITDFYGIKIGVISAGMAGRAFIKLLQDFVVDVLVYDPTLSAEQIRELGGEKRELEELFAESDVISIHAPNIPATDNMFNAGNLHLIKDGAIIINTARANVIDEPAFVEELRKNRFTAIIDVMEHEPPAPDHPYRSLPNVILLPHIAGAANNGCSRMGTYAVQEAERLIRGERMESEIDLSKLSTLA